MAINIFMISLLVLTIYNTRRTYIKYARKTIYNRISTECIIGVSVLLILLLSYELSQHKLLLLKAKT